jgi:hypothetical protein
MVYLTVVGRARPGVSLEEVRAEIETIGRRLAADYPEHNEKEGLSRSRTAC